MLKEIELVEGEYKCPECEGDGIVMGDYPYSDVCPKCLGEGKLDWIENAMGKKKKPIPIETIKLTANGRRLKDNWTIETEDNLQVLISEELLEEFAKIENKG